MSCLSWGERNDLSGAKHANLLQLITNTIDPNRWRIWGLLFLQSARNPVDKFKYTPISRYRA
jgi:hypothetical protein